MELTRLLADRTGFWRLSGILTILYKPLIYNWHFWAPAAPGALWAGLADLVGVAGWLPALAGLPWLGGAG